MAGSNGKTTLGISDLKDNFYKTSNEFNDNSTKLSSSAFRVYSLFKRMINEKKNGDEIWPSYSYIMKTTGLSRRTISRVINELVIAGWISEIKKGYNQVNHYHINDTPQVNNALVQSRANLALVPKVNSGSAKSKLPVVPKVNSNNTNRTILINNTSDLKIKNLEDRISDLSLKTDEERKQRLASLTQLLREEKYKKEHNLP